MRIAEKIFKRKSGKSAGTWVLRLQFEDELGRKKVVERNTSSKSSAQDLARSLVDDLKKTNGHIHVGNKMKFTDLSTYCKKHYYKAAEYSEGRKIAGVRSLKASLTAIAELERHFGETSIRNIHRTSLVDYKSSRLSTVSKRTNRNISIATVNRELATLRRMLKIALVEGWITRDPFLGAALINIADEKQRERILTRDEESRLLSACRVERKTINAVRYGKPLKMEIEVDHTHLKPLIVLALDTGMRRGELFKLRWEDVDFNLGLIRVCATHTKTQRERLVPLTPRAARELRTLRCLSEDNRVFPFNDLKKSFTVVRRAAGLEDVRFHDLRHTAITRMVRGGISMAEAGKVAGHSQPMTTYRYINNDVETIHRATSVLAEYDLPELIHHDGSTLVSTPIN